MVIHSCAKYSLPMSKSKEDIDQTKTHWTNAFDIEVKGQGHKKVRIVCKTSSHNYTTMCQIWYAYVRGQKSNRLEQKYYKFDLEVKGQGHTGVMNA